MEIIHFFKLEIIRIDTLIGSCYTGNLLDFPFDRKHNEFRVHHPGRVFPQVARVTVARSRLSSSG